MKGKNKGIKWTRVESSQIEAVAHNENINELYVKFKSGSIYSYSDVPESLYNELLTADSQGKFFIAHIKNDFKYTKIE
jgi:hypothetical protein